jgi:soluble lytic murein transglycosylase-like protein
MFRKFAVVLASTGVAVASLAATQATGAAPAALEAVEPQRQAELVVVERAADRFQQSIDVHAKRTEYRDLLEKARDLDAEPAEHVLERTEVSEQELSSGARELRERIEAARARKAAEAREARFASTGVSRATLDAIASCESGGDPTAVNAAGYYGKYQFDLGTWASVGGSGNPAEASEAEQDYRAGLLYQRAGSSPWPVCG